MVSSCLPTWLLFHMQIDVYDLFFLFIIQMGVVCLIYIYIYFFFFWDPKFKVWNFGICVLAYCCLTPPKPVELKIPSYLSSQFSPIFSQMWVIWHLFNFNVAFGMSESTLFLTSRFLRMWFFMIWMPRNVAVSMFGFIRNLLRFIGIWEDNVWFIYRNLK